MRHKQKFLLILLMGFFFLGMAGAPRQAESRDMLVARDYLGLEKTLTAIESAYEADQSLEVMPFIDQDFPDRISFNNKLEDYLGSHSSLSIYFVLDSVLSDKDKLSVRLHWFRKALDNSGVFIKSVGSSEIMFRSRGGALTILDIRGDNPFF